MTYTEEEAKTKWCPAVRFTGAGTATDQEWATNRGVDYGETAFCCIASECMAWRWDTALNADLLEEARTKYHEDPDIAEPLKDTPLYRDFLKSRHGFCGLAGKPE